MGTDAGDKFQGWKGFGMTIIRIKVDSSICSGCLSCVTTCSMFHEHYVSLSAGRIKVTLRPFETRHQIDICRQCVNHPCLTACPEGAIFRDQNDTVRIDDGLCTQCKICIAACPFQAIFWNPISEKVIKCDLCLGQPECVSACPTGALTQKILKRVQKGVNQEALE
jgi:Fe-S-cluster-containing dehydrogenase component